MNELVKVLGRFFTRDFLYILGGASVLLSVLYARDENVAVEHPIEIKMFFIGISYVIGYLIQDCLSLTPIITTSQTKPNRFLKWLYKRFIRREWEEIPQIDYIKTRTELGKKYPKKTFEELERIISLKHIGTTMGSCWLVSGMIIIGKGIYSKLLQVSILGTIIIALAIILLILGWLKGMEQYRLLHQLISADTKSKTPSEGNDRNS